MGYFFSIYFRLIGNQNKFGMNFDVNCLTNLNLYNMKTTFFLCLLICMFISCKKEDTFQTQLLKNSDMELNSSLDQSWVSGGNGTEAGFIYGWTNEESFSPVNSLNISRTVIEAENYWYYEQIYSREIPLGRDLMLNAKIKGVNLVGRGISIAIRCDGADPNIQFETTQGVKTINGTFDWTNYSVKLHKVNSAVTSIHVYLTYLPKTTGTAYFDDVTLSNN